MKRRNPSFRWAAGALGAWLSLQALPARGDCIYRWTTTNDDGDEIENVTNVAPKGVKGVKSECYKGGSSSSSSGSHVAGVGADGVIDLSYRNKVSSDVAAPTEFVPNEQSKAYDEYIRVACAKYNLPPSFVRAIINAESNFNPRAMSEKGALGLMQLMPETGAQMGAQDRADPQQNIMGGVRFLRELNNRFDGDMIKVAAAYNAGPQAVINYNGVPPYPETQNYVSKVLKLYKQYKAQAQAALAAASGAPAAPAAPAPTPATPKR